jgi:hypothetical protein
VIKKILFAASFLFVQLLQGQTVQTTLNLAYTSLCAYSSKFNDAFSFRQNAAALAGIKQFSGGLFSERRFGLQALTAYSFAVALPAASGRFGLKGDLFGSEFFRETTAGLAYGRKLGKQLDVGLGFDYTMLKAGEYGTASALTFDAGCILHLTENLHAGLHTYNPVGVKWSKTEERLPSIYSAGLGYDVSDQLFIGAEMVKTEGQPMTINAGLQYVFASKLFARAGIGSATSVSYLGFGVQLSHFRVDAAASFHPYLGLTPGLMLLYSPQK